MRKLPYSRKTFAFRLAAFSLVACVLPITAQAQNTIGPDARTIIVSGSGQASGVPDIARLSLGVETQAPSAREAIAKNNTELSKTIDTLKKQGIAAKDIQTSAISVNPQYDYSNRQTPRLTGYTANNNLSVTLRDLDKAGQVLDAVLNAGANRMNGFSFGFENSSPILDKARIKAVKEAQRKAGLLAEAAGVKLGALLRINDGAQSRNDQAVNVQLARAASESAVPIERGESTLSASVTLIYAISD